MTQELTNLKHRLNQSKLELVKLKSKEKELIYNFGETSATVSLVKNNIDSQIGRIKDIETQLKDSANQDDGNTQIKELESKAYAGDTDAINKLIELASGRGDPLKASAIGIRAKQILCDLAQTGDNTVGSILIDAFPKDPGILQSLVVGNSAYAQEAAEKFADQLGTDGVQSNPGEGNTVETLSPQMRELILQKLSSDPEANIHLIAKFADTMTGAAHLTDIAVNKPTTYAGSIAARALGKAFIKGNMKVSNAALSGLKAAGMAGNAEAVRTLVNVVKSSATSENKAMQAIDALTEIASAGSQSGSENTDSALGGLINLATDKNVSPKLRSKVIANLGKLIGQGADPNHNATDALIKLAKTDNNAQVAEQARESIFKAAESNDSVKDRAVSLFSDVASGHLPATQKVKAQAVDLLAGAMKTQGPNAGEAKDSLIRLTRNPNKIIAMRALKHLKEAGIAVNKDEPGIKPLNGEEIKGEESKRLLSKDFTIMG
jgi:hypothetical protein